MTIRVNSNSINFSNMEEVENRGNNNTSANSIFTNKGKTISSSSQTKDIVVYDNNGRLDSKKLQEAINKIRKDFSEGYYEKHEELEDAFKNILGKENISKVDKYRDGGSICYTLKNNTTIYYNNKIGSPENGTLTITHPDGSRETLLIKENSTRNNNLKKLPTFNEKTIKNTTESTKEGEAVTTFDGYEKNERISEIEEKFGRIKSKSVHTRSGNFETGARTEKYFPSTITEYQTEDGWVITITETYMPSGTQRLQNAEKKFQNPDGTIKTINYEGNNYGVYTETLTDSENKPISKLIKTPDGTHQYYTPINNQFMLSEIVSGKVTESIQYSKNYNDDGIVLKTTKIDGKIIEEKYYLGENGELKISHFDDNSTEETFFNNNNSNYEYIKKVISEDGTISYLTSNHRNATQNQIEEFNRIKEKLMPNFE